MSNQALVCSSRCLGRVGGMVRVRPIFVQQEVQVSQLPQSSLVRCLRWKPNWDSSLLIGVHHSTILPEYHQSRFPFENLMNCYSASFWDQIVLNYRTMIFSKHYQVTSDHHDLFTAVTDLGGDCKLDIYSSDVMLGKVRRQSFFLYFHWAPMLLVDRTTQVVCIVLYCQCHASHSGSLL